MKPLTDDNMAGRESTGSDRQHEPASYSEIRNDHTRGVCKRRITAFLKFEALLLDCVYFGGYIKLHKLASHQLLAQVAADE